MGAEDKEGGSQVVYCKNDDVIRSEEAIGAETVVLPNPSNAVYVLNAAGSRIWGALAAGTSLAALKAGFAPAHHGAVERVFDDLRDANLIGVCADTAQAVPAPDAQADTDPPMIVHWITASEEAQAAYVGTALEQAQAVAARPGAEEYCYDIAGVTIRVVFATRALAASLAPALEGHRAPSMSGPPQSTLYVRDGGSSGLRLDAPASAAYFAENGCLLGMNSERLRLAFHTDVYGLSLARDDDATGMFWVADLDGLDLAAGAHPLQTVLAWMLQSHGRQVVPASVMSREGMAVLAVGTAAEPAGGGAIMAASPVVLDAERNAWPLFAAAQGTGTRIMGLVTPVPDTCIGGLSVKDQAEVALRRQLQGWPRLGRAGQICASRLAQTVACSLTPHPASRDITPDGNAPPVSVIVPVFNEFRYLRAALQSVADQGEAGVEVILVDDGSDPPLAGSFDDLPFDVRIVRQGNAGPAAARNTGIRAARGDLLAFLDGDDLWTEGRLAAMRAALVAAPEADVAMGFGLRFRVAPGASDIEVIETPQEAFPFYVGSALYRRKAFALTGLYDETMRFAEDTDWFFRARENLLDIRHLGIPTLLVRRHDTNMTGAKSLVELGELRAIKKKHDRLFWRDRRYPDWPRDPWGLRGWKDAL